MVQNSPTAMIASKIFLGYPPDLSFKGRRRKGNEKSDERGRQWDKKRGRRKGLGKGWAF